MLFSKRKRTPAPGATNAVGRLVNLAVIGLILAMVVNEARHPSGEPKPTPDALTNAASPLMIHYVEAAQKNAIQLLGEIGFRPANRVLEEGKGTPALCGQTVQYKLAVVNLHDNNPATGFEGLDKTTRSLRLGSAGLPGAPEVNSLAQGLLIGLAPGGMHEITISKPKLMYLFHPEAPQSPSAPPEALRLRATLLSAAPAMPTAEAPLTVVETQAGDANLRASCGAAVPVQLRAFTAEGKPVALTPAAASVLPLAANVAVPSGSVTLRAAIGAGTLPYGIERGIEGLGAGGTRVLLVPPAYQAPFLPTLPPMLTLPQPAQLLMIELSVLPPSALQPSTPVETSPAP